MKKAVIFLLAVFSFATLFGAWDAQKTDKFLDAMAKAVDPDGNSKNIRTFEIMTECLIQPVNMKMQSQIFFKIPGKIKSVMSVPNISNTTLYFDGEKGFKVDTLAGVVPLEGKVLEETKLTALEMNPVKKLKDIFDKIEIDDQMEVRDGKKYVVVNCYPKPSSGLFPKKYLVDPQSKLIVYGISKSNTDMGVLEGVTRVLKFKKMHGVMMAEVVEQTMMNMKVIGTVKYFNVNTEYPDSFFEYKE
ncbi:MAG: hypothetical protein IKB71_06085 [Lentisphaeria bacterium]|nr:hypothetical protein [Lentisphaeria bacterium]